MRIDPIPPEALSDEQRPLDADMRATIADALQGFTTQDERGALVGPFAPLLAYPQWGGPAWRQSASLIDHKGLPARVREVAILTTGAATQSRYELYAHSRVAAGAGLDEATIAALAAGERPGSLSEEEAVAHDVAAALVRGGPLPGATYRAAQAAFGDEGTAELIFLVAAYAGLSVVLNGFDVPVPGGGTED